MGFRAFDRWRAFDALRIYSDGSESPGVTPVFDWLASTGSLDAAMSIARAGTAYARDNFGDWNSIASNLPRFDHTDGSTQYLLVEPSNTNWIPRTLNYAGGWLGSAATFSTTTAISGLVTARVVQTGGNTQHYAYRNAFPDASAATTWTYAIFIKPGANCNFVHMLGGGAGTYAQWNAATGELVYSGGATLVDSGYETCQNGELWVWATFSGTTRPTVARVYPLQASQNSAGPSEDASSTQASLDFYAPSFTPSSFRGSPILTEDAIVTRAAETLSISGLPALNESRITLSDDSTIDLDDWNGTRAPTVPERIKQITVYNPGDRPA